jgi:hypothetical protein
LSQFIELEGMVLENVYGTGEEKSKLIKRGKRKIKKKNFYESEGYQAKNECRKRIRRIKCSRPPCDRGKRNNVCRCPYVSLSSTL